MVIADKDKREINALKSILKRGPSFGKKKRVLWADLKNDDVPVLVAGTKSWPVLSDAQTPKPKNHVENVAAPAYAFPPGSGPYLNGENPKPVFPVAARQDLHQIDLNEPVSVQDPMSPRNRHSVGEKSVDVPVLVVGTKSWPALSDAQTPKPKNVEKVSAKGKHVAVSVPSVGHVTPRAPSVQKSNGSGNINLMHKMPSSRYQKPGPKRNVRPVAPPPQIALPAYAFPPGCSGPYPNGTNPKPVSPVAAGQESTERRRKVIRITRKTNLNKRVSVQDPSEHSMEQHQHEKFDTDIIKLDRDFVKLIINSNENNLIQAESVPGESHAPKRENRKRVHWAEDEKSVDVPVLVVGTKSWPALSDVQTPKPKNHVDNEGENVAVSVPSVGHLAPRAPSVQKLNCSGNFNPMNKMTSPHKQKPGPKRNSNTNGTSHFSVSRMPYHQQPPVTRPPSHIAVPAYAFPPGSGPYPNGENPKPVSPVAAGQGFTPPARAIDDKHFPSFPESMEGRKRKPLACHIDLNDRASVQDPFERNNKKKRNSNDTLLILPAEQQITQMYHLLVVYPIGTTPPNMKTLEKIRNWLANEL